jgi:hypothetical protein
LWYIWMLKIKKGFVQFMRKTACIIFALSKQ